MKTTHSCLCSRTDLTLWAAYQRLSPSHRMAFLERLHKEQPHELMYAALTDEERIMLIKTLLEEEKCLKD